MPSLETLCIGCSRFHYSVDVMVAFVTSILVWHLLHFVLLTSKFRDQRELTFIQSWLYWVDAPAQQQSLLGKGSASQFSAFQRWDDGSTALDTYTVHPRPLKQFA